MAQTVRFLSMACALLSVLISVNAQVKGGHQRSQELVKLEPTEIETIAEQGYIFGLPIVMNYVVMHDYVLNKNSGQFKAPFNVINNEHRVFTYKDTAVVTPNSDTPYSMTWLDLRTEPVVISVPAVEKERYYSVQLNDGNTFNYGYIGSRSTGNGKGNYLIAGPDWQGSRPDGIDKIFRSTTYFSLAIFRTQLFNASDMPNVIEVQNGYRVQALSGFLGISKPAPAPDLSWPWMNSEKLQSHFFVYLDFLLQFAPATSDEVAIRSQLKKMGVGNSQPFSIDQLSPEQRVAMMKGIANGERKVAAKAKALGKEINGWFISSAFGDREFYKGDWLLRAAAARAGIYGNNAEEATYPMTRSLADGALLDGSKHNYRLTFAKDYLPPVNAFWSVTIYDGKTQLLVQNPINRYLINSPMLSELGRNADGSITIYIQKDSPGKELEANWLPAPDGPIYIAMRLYWPRVEDPSVLPPGNGTWKPPALMMAN
ncbi:DUF1254 domain-containing protein [Zwartia vadi]|uniref:DUF1254 domain-containing protein n=1 Tax=Zwartia vadi TaxID=3058168 RepID=UPI0025B528CB|nr:DUF1254 domain-containing protein [Zwartia vadi]MDN3987559.1 DUF1254 domain-containing protein [Zwartia vadi]